MKDNNVKFLEKKGYVSKVDATEHIRLWYGNLEGVTLIFKNDRWFIVQSAA